MGAQLSTVDYPIYYSWLNELLLTYCHVMDWKLTCQSLYDSQLWIWMVWNHQQFKRRKFVIIRPVKILSENRDNQIESVKLEIVAICISIDDQMIIFRNRYDSWSKLGLNK